MNEKGTDMKTVNERILSEIEKIQLVDTHEHIMPEADRNRCALDFSYLFGHYNSSDLVSAGMPPRLMEAFRLPIHRYRTAYIERTKLRRHLPEPASEDMSLEERWRAVEPYWEAMRNTAYAKVTLLAAKALFGIDDLNKDTYQNLSLAIAESRQPGWYRHVMREKAGIENSILDIMTTDVDQELFSPIQKMDYFIDIRSRQELGHLEAESGTAIHCLDDLVKAMQTVLERSFRSGAVGVKIALAYARTLEFDKITRYEAETTFNALSTHLGEGPSFSDAKPLQDYMMHQVVRAAIDSNRPLQIHTGLQEGNENIITNANPTHLVNLFIEYRDAKFDLFHGGYPFVHEWATLAKNFANVYADMCWVYIISPDIGRRLLHELIETVPGNKIMAFGGDSLTVEIAYGHAIMARQAVARVLSEKVAEGYMGEDEAIKLASLMLRDNPAKLFNISPGSSSG